MKARPWLKICSQTSTGAAVIACCTFPISLFCDGSSADGDARYWKNIFLWCARSLIRGKDYAEKSRKNELLAVKCFWKRPCYLQWIRVLLLSKNRLWNGWHIIDFWKYLHGARTRCSPSPVHDVNEVLALRCEIPSVLASISSLLIFSKMLKRLVPWGRIFSTWIHNYFFW